MVSHLTKADLTNRRVFLRADLNIPLLNGLIVCDFRLKALKPTLDLLIAKRGRIILATHLGRPQGPIPSLSTRLLLSWFKEHGYTIQWISSLEEAVTASHSLAPQSILLLENMRFFEGEQSADKTIRMQFAQQLRALADYYVNDAFALLHRHDTSITLLPALFNKDDKTIGLLIEHEIDTLTALFAHPLEPFMLVIGGGKVKDKLPFLEKLLDKVSSIIILPALAFTFLKAQGKPIGRSLVDDDFLERAKAFLTKAQEKSVRIILPSDFLVAEENFAGPLHIVTEIPAQSIGIAVGPQTLQIYAEEIGYSKTVFINGAMGLTTRPETLEPFYSILGMVASPSITSIVGGGESVAAVYASNLEHTITYCSTGGGASLYLLTYTTLPALASME